MHVPYFSFIVSVYNTSSYLNKCLDSLVHQDYNPDLYEIIIVNDCSTDNSLAIIQDFMGSHPSIQLINKDRNEGTFWSRIDGMKAAAGQYLIIVDSDDWLNTTALSDLAATLKITGEVDLLEPGYILEEDCSSIIYDHDKGSYNRQFILSEYANRKIYSSLWLRIYNQQIVQQLLDITDYYFKREDYIGVCIEDEYISPLLLASARIYHAAPVAYYHYRAVREGSSMTSIARDQTRKLIHIKTVLHAADKLLTIYQDEAEQFACFFALQTNNLFYYMGEILRLNSTQEIPSFAKAMKQHKRLFRLNFSVSAFHDTYLRSIMLRSLHLFVKSRLLFIALRLRR